MNSFRNATPTAEWTVFFDRCFGDNVRVKYLDEDEPSLVVALTEAEGDPDKGVVNVESPLGRALLGAEVDQKVEVLIGGRIRPALIEEIVKGR